MQFRQQVHQVDDFNRERARERERGSQVNQLVLLTRANSTLGPTPLT